MNNDNTGKIDQQANSPQPAPESAPQTDNRQQAIEQEQDTARLRSERKSVEDGSGLQPEE